VSTGKRVLTSEERNASVLAQAVGSSDVGTHVRDHKMSQQRETQYGFHHIFENWFYMWTVTHTNERVTNLILLMERHRT
jgi:hypothetical protein